MPEKRPPAEPPEEFRWQTWFQRSDEGVYLLSARKRLLFANRAWEKLTGLLLKEVRGRVCRRRPRSVLADKSEAILSALAAPPETWKGEGGQARRLLPCVGRDSRWVRFTFLPLAGAEGLLGVVCTIKLLPAPLLAASTPLPARVLAYRDRSGLPLEAWASETPAMARVGDQARLAAANPGLALTIVGADGCGRRTLARSIHQASPWRERFFAAIDCERLPPRALSDILTTPERILGPVEVLLFKEPAALPRDLQCLLADALDEDAERPTRWIMAAARHAPGDEVTAGRMLETLGARLGTLVIPVPTLRERGPDLPRLAEAMLAEEAALASAPPATLAPAALADLAQHDWPGNLSELRRVLRGAAQHASGHIDRDHLPLYVRGEQPPTPERALALDELLEKVERRMIALALRLAEGNRKKAADLLGIWRPRLLRRIESLGIEG